MEGHMHEHGPLYTSVPLVMFDEGGWCGVVVVVVVVVVVLVVVVGCCGWLLWLWLWLWLLLCVVVLLLNGYIILNE